MSDFNAITYNNVAGETLAAKTLYDTQALPQNAKSVSFFPTQPTNRTATLNNYGSNPLTGAFTVFGLGFETNTVVIKTAAGIDPIKIGNAIRDGVVEFKTEDGTRTLFTAPLGQFLAVEQVALSADAAIVVVHLRSNGILRLQQPFQIAQGMAFEMYVTPVDTSVLPSDAQWAAANYPTLKLRAMIQGLDSAEYARQEAAAASR